MSFAGASFAETAFASQATIDANVAVSGLPLTAVVGTASVTAIANPNVSVTGVSTSVTIGGSGVSAGGNAEVTLAGLTLTSTLGEETIVVDSPNVSVTGQGLTITQGTATALSSTNPQPVGEDLQTALGTPTVVAVQNVNISVTGQALTSTLNNSGISVVVDANPVLSPLTLVSVDLGTPTVQLNGDVEVTGFGLSVSLSDATAIYAWTEVDDSVTTTWTEVDDSATMTWRDAA